MTAGDRKNGGAALVVALARGDTVADAATVAGVSEATVYRRLREPAFRRQVDDVRADMIRQAVARLSAASTEAADTLRALLASEMDFARLAAARSILELGTKLREHEDLAERVRRLEERLGDATPTTGKGVRQWAS